MKKAYYITADRSSDTKIGIAFVSPDVTSLELQDRLVSCGYPATVQVRPATLSEVRRELVGIALTVVGLPLTILSIIFIAFSF